MARAIQTYRLTAPQMAHLSAPVAAEMGVPSVEDKISSGPMPATVRGIEILAACVVFWLMATLLQWQGGAYRAEFGSHPDEAAHYVTGLMIHDWIASGHLATPVAFAKDFYAHYPKVAFGIWPPLFHILEALWMLVFTPSKVSVLLLEALIGAALATALYRVLRRRYSVAISGLGGTLFLLLPLERHAARAVMVDGLVALLAFVAMIFLVRYVDSGRSRDAVWFGIFAGLCMGSKSNGVALVLLPIFVILLTGRFDLLRRPGLYYAAGIVLAIGAPWQLVVYQLNRGSLATHYHEAITVADRLGVARDSLWLPVASLQWSLVPFFLVGFAVYLARTIRGNRTNTLLAGAFGLLLSVTVFHTTLGICEPRYLLMTMPGTLILTFFGIEWVARRIEIPSISVSTRTAALAGLAGLAFLAQTWNIPPKPYRGMDQTVRLLLNDHKRSHGDYLVVGDACGEGAFVAEVAMHDRRPAHYVYRGSKLLSSSTWYGDNYQFQYRNIADLRKLLRRAPVKAVVLDTSHPTNGECNPLPAEIKLGRDVEEAMASNQVWKLGTSPSVPEQEPAVRLYERHGQQPSGGIRVNPRFTMGSEGVVSTRSRAAVGLVKR